MAPEVGGYWSAHDERGRDGDRYRFSLEDGKPIPDPASRYQPVGVHEASACVDPHSFAWQARDLHPSGAVGDATQATAEKGERLLDHGARAFCELLGDVDRFDPKALSNLPKI